MFDAQGLVDDGVNYLVKTVAWLKRLMHLLCWRHEAVLDLEKGHNPNILVLVYFQRRDSGNI